MTVGVKVQPGHYRLVVVVAVDAQPMLIVEDDFEAAVLGQLYAQRVTQATQSEAHMIVANRLNGLG